MRSLPLPVSKRRTLQRVDQINRLCDRLLTDPHLSQVSITNPAAPESHICKHVQDVLNDFVNVTFRPRHLHKVTWMGEGGKGPMPNVQIGGHRYFPDHIVWRNDFTVAFEVKRYTGSSSTLQQIIGQSIIYTQWYGFVVVFIADVTEQGTLANRLNADPLHKDDQWLLSQLWWFHNTSVVCRRVKE